MNFEDLYISQRPSKISLTLTINRKGVSVTVLLLTSCIAPNAAMPNHIQFNPQERLEEYRRSLLFYIDAVPQKVAKILFCDNSGWSLRSLEDLQDQNTRPDLKLFFESYKSPVDPKNGKGRSELELIDHAMQRFSVELQDDPIIWKVTGRHRLVNIAKMVETQPEDLSFYADFRSLPLIGNRLGANHAIDMRAFAFRRDGYERYLKGRWEEAWVMVEKYLFAEIYPDIGCISEVYPRLRSQPIFIGSSGYDGRDYSSMGYRAKNAIRAALRRLAPGIWI